MSTLADRARLVPLQACFHGFLAHTLVAVLAVAGGVVSGCAGTTEQEGSLVVTDIEAVADSEQTDASATDSRALDIATKDMHTAPADSGADAAVDALDTNDDAAVDASPDAPATDVTVGCADLSDGADCDDGDPCTADDRCESGKCTGTGVCGCATDGECAVKASDLCLGTPICDKSKLPWVCGLKPGSKVVCKGQTNPCLAEACVPKTGDCLAAPINEGGQCDPSDPCIVGAACKAGVCKGKDASWCECNADKDCAQLEDGDVCNGTLYCNTAKFPHFCKINEGTIIACSDAEDGQCIKSQCDPIAGTCGLKPVANGAKCDDGNKCTANDACDKGACAGKTDTCKCAKDADCDDQEDGNLCNGVLYCDKDSGKCLTNPKSVIVCPTVADGECEKNTCNPLTGTCALTAVKPGQPCSDGDACTSGEVCLAGACGSGANICSCQADIDCISKDDGDKCNGFPYCNKATGSCEPNPASAVVCATVNDTLCRKNRCDKPTGVCGMANEATGTLCQDGDSCTVGDTCAAGSCQPGTFVCTCKTDGDCAKEEDGNFCNGTMFCDVSLKAPKCKVNPSTVVSCPKVDDSDCRKRRCEPKSGKCLLTSEPDGRDCDDGDKCTQSDYCTAGACKAGAFTCECSTDEHCAKFDDGDKCNGVPFCDKSGSEPKCAPNPASKVFCPQTSLDVCLTDSCNPNTGKCGLVAGKTGALCDDGSKCTALDACADGKCAGQAIDCDDKSACTFDGCDPKIGCTHKQENCNDNNTCTVDQCDAKTGKCAFPPRPDGAGCDNDGSACTVGDTCKSGVCEAGPPVTCQITGGACSEARCVSQGATNFKCILANKTDGTACDDGNACTVSGVCATGKCLPGTAHRLFERDYQAPKGSDEAWFNDAVVSQAGAIAVGGWQKGVGSGALNGWWLHRTDVTGNEAVSLALPSTATDPAVQARAIATLPGDAGYVVVGGTAAGSDVQARVLWLDSKLAPHLDKAFGAKQSDDAATDVGVQVDGTAWVVGWRMVGGEPAAWATRVTSSGQALWDKLLAGEVLSGLRAVIVRVDSTAVVSGDRYDGASKARLGWVAAVRPDGSLIWERGYGGGVQQSVDALVQTPDAGLLGAGWRKGKDGRNPWLLRLEPDGSERWSRVEPGLFEAAALVGLGPKHFAVAGRTAADGASSDAWLAGLDQAGNVHWTVGKAGGGDDRLNAVVAASDGGLLAVGNTSEAGKPRRGLLVRTDAFGHKTCDSAGKCAGKAADACDDDKSCTVDFCDPAKACVHVAATGLTCDPGNSCAAEGQCKGGACVPTGRQRLYAKSYTTLGLKTADAVSAAPGGGVVVAGCTEQKDGTAVKRQLLVLRLDRFGTQIGQATTDDKAINCGGVFGVIGLDNGHAAVGYNEPGGAEPVKLLRVDATGKVVWLRAVPHGVPSGWPHYYYAQGRTLTPTSGGQAALVMFEQWHLNKSTESRRSVWGRSVQLTDGAVSGYVKTRGDWSWYFYYIEAAAARADGTIVLAGGHTRTYAGAPSTNRAGMVLHVTASGSTITEAWKWEAAHRNYTAVAVMKDGSDTAAGAQWVGSKQHLVLANYAPGGKLRWERIAPNPQIRLPRAAFDHPQGFVLLGQSGATEALLWQGLYSPLGALLRERAYAPTGEAKLGTIAHVPGVAMSAGGVVQIGTAKAFGFAAPFVVRTDDFGYANCVDAGKCVTETSATCSDGDACTTDLCDAAAGCSSVKRTCDDGNACTTSAGCNAGDCALAPTNCDDGNVCTDDACDADKGCTHANNSAQCADDNPCTVAESCAGGKCISTAKVCTSLPCQIGVCDAKKGCSVSDAKDGKVCKAGCGPGACSKGKCALDPNAKTLSGWLIDTPKLASLQAFDHSPGGGYVFAGCSTTKQLAAGRIDGEGNLETYALVPGPEFACEAVKSTVGLADGQQIIVYHVGGYDGSRAVRLDADLGKVWQVTVPRYDVGKYKFPYSYAVTAYGYNGGKTVAVVLNPYSADWNMRPAFVRRIDSESGSVSSASRMHASWSAHDRFHIVGVQPINDSTALAFGSYYSRHAKGANGGWLARIPPGGGYNWRFDMGNKEETAIRAGVQLPDGQFVVAGTKHANGTNYPFMLGVSAAGQQLWRRQETKPGVGVPLQMKLLGADNLLVVAQTGGDNPKPWLGQYDTAGALLKARTYSANAADKLTVNAAHSLLDRGPPGWLLGATRAAFGVGSAFFILVDPFGNAVCEGLGKCAGKTHKACDDGDPCTLETCDVATGCKTPTRSCDDGNACTEGDKCDKGACVVTNKTCNDANDCTDDSCNPATGCVFTNNSAACPDSDPCTEAETCKAGKCTTDEVVCDVSKPCQVAKCDATQGCVFSAGKDGGACPAGCLPGTCKSGTCAATAGADKLVGWTFDTPGLNDTGAIDVAPGGGFVVAGCTSDKTLAALRVNADGSTATYSETSGATALSCNNVLTVVGLGGGHMAVVYNTAVGATRARITRFSDQLAPVWTVDVSKDHPPQHSSYNTSANEAVRLANGQSVDVVMMHTYHWNYRYRSTVHRRVNLQTGAMDGWGTLFSSGKPYWHRYPHGSVELGSGQIAFAGYDYDTHGSGKSLATYSHSTGWLARTSPGGGQHWVYVAQTTAASYLDDVVELENGDLFAIGREETAARRLTWTRVTSGGKLLSYKVEKSSTIRFPSELHLVDAGTVILGGTKGTTDPQPWLGWYDLNGGRAIERTFTGGAGAKITGARRPLVKTKTGWAHLSTRKIFGTASPFIIQTDDFGNGVCAGSGGCKGLLAQDCVDNDACTFDFCDAAKGCTHAPVICADDDACTVAEVCKGAQCISSKKDCDDKNICTSDSCNPATGCVHSNNSAACDDGDMCTQSDVCSGGACGVAKVLCSVGKACHSATCDSKKGCIYSPIADGTACQGGCAAGTCKAGKCEENTSGAKTGGKLYDAPGLAHAADLGTVPGGGYVITGCSQDEKLYAMRVDGDGQVAVQGTVDVPEIACKTARGAFAQKGGHLAVAVWDNSGTTKPTLVGLDEQLAIKWQTPIDNSTYHSRDTHGMLAVAHPDGQQAAIVSYGYYETGNSPRRYVMGTRFELATGKATGRSWVGYASSSKGGSRFAPIGVHVRGDGSMLVSGSHHYIGSPTTAWLTRTGFAYGYVWQAFAPERSGIATYLYDAATLPGEVYFGVGSWYQSGVSRPYFARVSATGQFLWERLHPDPQARIPSAIVSEGNRLVIAGHSTHDPPRAWLGWFNTVGLSYGERLFAGQPATGVFRSYAPILALPSGKRAWLASQNANAQAKPMLIEFDDFGHTTCVDAGGCTGKTLAKSCNDGNGCTFDFCDPIKGCTHANISCDDGDKCTTDACDGTGGCNHVKVVCNDGNACTDDACVADKGCTYAANTGSCDDGDKCATADKCVGGACVTEVLVCDDDEACTTDSCDPKTGCVFKAHAEKSACVTGPCAEGTCFSGKCFNIEKDKWQGCSKANPAQSCKQILTDHPGAPGFLYWLDPDGGGPATSRQVLCDMAGGGWSRMARYEFSQDSQGWLPAKVSTCGGWGSILGGAGVLGKGAAATRKVKELPAHTRLKVRFDLLRLDSWEAENAYLKADGVVMWQSTFSTSGSNTCGSSAGDSRHSNLLPWTLHTLSEVDLEFGAELDEAPSNEAFGVDNVEIWVR